MEKIIGLFRTLDKIFREEEDPIEIKKRQAVEFIQKGNIILAKRYIKEIELLEKLRECSIFDLNEFVNMDKKRIWENVQRIFLDTNLSNNSRNVYSLGNAITCQTVAYKLIQDGLYDVAEQAINESVNYLKKLK